MGRYNTFMSDINVDSNLLIQDLISQVNRLTSENTVLRVAVQQYRNMLEPQGSSSPLPSLEDMTEDTKD